MMTERTVQDLMRHLPEEYLEEAAAYRMAHAAHPRTTATFKEDAPPRFFLRAALPIAAVACFAAVCGLIWWVGSKDDLLTVESHVYEIDEQQPPATQTEATSAADSGTSGTTATTHSGTETVQGSARVTATATGTQTQGKTPTQGTASVQAAQGTAKQTAKTTSTATKQPATAETEPKLPYDPEIVAQYRLGDVNMDGFVNIDDAQLLFNEYYVVVVCGEESILTPEQRYLGDVTDARIVPEDVIRHGMIGGVPAIETDYIISSADAYLLEEYYLITSNNGIPMYPVEKFLVQNIPPIEDRHLYYPPGLIEMKGDVDADTDEESVYFPGFGWLPVRVEGEKNWRLSWYSYYNASAYYGSNPVYCCLNVRYFCEDDGLEYKVEYSLYPDGEAADLLAKRSESDEYVPIRPDDPTIFLKYSNNHNLWDRLDLCNLKWTEGNWFVNGHIYGMDETNSEEDYLIFADHFYHICTLE